MPPPCAPPLLLLLLSLAGLAVASVSRRCSDLGAGSPAPWPAASLYLLLRARRRAAPKPRGVVIRRLPTSCTGSTNTPDIAPVALGGGAVQSAGLHAPGVVFDANGGLPAARQVPARPRAGKLLGLPTTASWWSTRARFADTAILTAARDIGCARVVSNGPFPRWAAEFPGRGRQPGFLIPGGAHVEGQLRIDPRSRRPRGTRGGRGDRLGASGDTLVCQSRSPIRGVDRAEFCIDPRPRQAAAEVPRASPARGRTVRAQMRAPHDGDLMHDPTAHGHGLCGAACGARRGGTTFRCVLHHRSADAGDPHAVSSTPVVSFANNTLRGAGAARPRHEHRAFACPRVGAAARRRAAGASPCAKASRSTTAPTSRRGLRCSYERAACGGSDVRRLGSPRSEDVGVVDDFHRRHRDRRAAGRSFPRSIANWMIIGRGMGGRERCRNPRPPRHREPRHAERQRHRPLPPSFVRDQPDLETVLEPFRGGWWGGAEAHPDAGGCFFTPIQNPATAGGGAALGRDSS